MTTTHRQPVRIGAVSYLNSKPLIESLPELVPDSPLLLDYPSRLADDLANGELDVALIPSVECLRDPDYEIVSDACVATRGEVLSVKLYSRVPIEQIRTLALDEGSRTSAALVQILLAERFGVRPERHPFPMGSQSEDCTADSILIIGDRAIHPPREQFAATWDLGQEWTSWTGLPFVFAMWATRKNCELGTVEDALVQARNIGVSQLEQIAKREAVTLQLSESTAYTYLTDNLHYQLGPAERDGLRLFQQLAAKWQLVPGGNELVFRNYTHS